MSTTGDFILVSTPEEQLQVFLRRVLDIHSNVVQNKGALALMGHKNPILLSADGQTGQVWHIVASDGTSVRAVGYISVINLLIGLGVRCSDVHEFHARWAKAKRIYGEMPEDGDPRDADWAAFAKARGLTPPSDITVLIIEQLAREDGLL